MRKILNKIIYLPIFYPRILFNFCRTYLYRYVQYEVYRDWGNNKVPMYFKHEVDLYSTYFSGDKGVEWMERGVYARKEMFKKCLVLDLCCGDGFYPYLFYSDIASRIDAIDYDKEAIEFSKKYHQKENIFYSRVDIISGDFPSKDYNFVIWNTAIDYFTKDQQRSILSKIINHSNNDFKLIGAVSKSTEPLTDDPTKRNRFKDVSKLEELLKEYFEVVEIFTTTFNHRVCFNFKCYCPLNK